MEMKKQTRFKTGIFTFILKVIRYIKRNYFSVSKTIIFELNLDRPGLNSFTELDLYFRLATGEDILSMDKENYDYDEKAKQYFINRLEKGDRCILALHRNKIISYLWVMNGLMELTEYRHIILSNNRAFSYKEFVLEEYRGKRVHSTIYAYLANMLKNEGKCYVVSTVDADNKLSLMTRSRSNFKVIGNIIRIRFFGFSYDYLKKKYILYLQNE